MKSLKEDLQKRFDREDKPVEVKKAEIVNRHLEIEVVEYLKAYGDSFESEKVFKGKWESEKIPLRCRKFVFDKKLNSDEAEYFFPLLVRDNYAQFPTRFFENEYYALGQEKIPFDTITLTIKRYFD